VSDEVLIVAYEVWVVSFYAEAKKSKQLLDQKLPLIKSLIFSEKIIIFRPRLLIKSQEHL
jgi:hypothetical protein